MFTILIIIVVTAAFALAGLVGAPYVPILGRDRAPLLDLAELKPGQTLIDLGSGDGQLLRLAAARGIRCIGYEINPFMVAISRLVTWRYRRFVTIHLANFWNVKLPPANVIYVFLIPKRMSKLDQKLATEITQPTQVVSYAFEIPGRTPAKQTKNTFAYEYGTAQ